jgi:hypothetical protein
MELSFKRGRGLAVALLVSLAIPAAVRPEGGPPSQAVPRDPQVEGALAGFEAWASRYLASAASPGSAVSPLAAEGVALARERRQALLTLARQDPRRVIEQALSPAVLKRLPPEVQQESETYVDACSSEFGVAIADDFTQGDAPVSRVTRSLTVGDREYEARVFGRRAGLTSKAIHANGVALDGVIVLFETPLRRMDAAEAAEDRQVQAQCAGDGACIPVKVGGQTLVFRDEAALRRHEAALERDEAKLDPDQPAGPPEAVAPLSGRSSSDLAGPPLPSVWTTGEKDLLYMRVDFSDLPGEPVAASTVQTVVDVDVSTFYEQTSYDKTLLRATVTPVLRMPRTAAEYRTIGDGQLLTDARATARTAGFDTALFELDLVAFARLFDGYSGKARVGGKGIWLNGSFGASVTAHELGHNYGVHHANWWQTTDGTVIGAGSNVEYGNVFDVMGRGGIRGQFNAWFKSRLDWLLPADYTTVTASGTYTIQPVDEPTATGLRALKIVKDTTRSYWVEFRQLYTTNRWAMNGAMLNWGYNNNTGSHLLDYTPGSSNSQNDAPVLVGRTFSDTASGIHITPLLRAGTPPTMDVVVNLGTFPGNAAPTGTLAASSATVPRNAPVTFTVSATDGNGDPLAYGWVFDDGTIAPNAASVTKSWSTAGTKLVQCVISDMVGGTTTVSTTVTVSSVSVFTVSGSVTAAGQPLGGVVVTDGTRTATTNAAGAYTIAGVPNGTYTLTPSLSGFTFSPATLGVTVNGANLSGRNFTAAPVPTDIILEARFNSGPDGFTYADDAFRATAQPAYASGTWVASGGFSGGALRVALGGINETDVVGMSGGWTVSFTLAEAREVGLSFRHRLTQTPDYESDERSESLASVDGVPLGPSGVLAQVVGNGNGGSSITTGFLLFQQSLGVLPAGSHTIVIGGFNSQKTTTSESTELLIDDVIVYRP